MAGILLPLMPFIDETDGFSIFWGYSFRDKTQAIQSALLIYGSVLLLVFAGVSAGIAWSRVTVRTRRVRWRRGWSFERRARLVIGVGLASILVTIVLLGGVENWLLAGSDRIRQFAGLNFIVMLQNSLLSVSLAWFIKIASRHQPLSLLCHLRFIAFSVLALMLVALQGAKSTVFVYLLAMLIVWHVRVRQLSFLRLALIGCLTFVLLMVYHVVKQEYLVVGEFVFYDQQEGFFASFSRMLFQQLTGNLMQLQCMAVLVDAIPNELSFQQGETLKMVFLIWLPSLLFPDKPPTAPGVFTLALWPEKWENEATTMPPGLFGEFYLNFGWVGVAFGALIFGAVYGVAYGRAARSGRDVPLGIYVMMAGVMLHYFRGELAAVTVLLLSMLVPLVWMLRGELRTDRRMVLKHATVIAAGKN